MIFIRKYGHKLTTTRSENKVKKSRTEKAEVEIGDTLSTQEL